MATPNVQSVIWEYVTTTATSLFTLVGTRIWHSAYPDSAHWANETAGIVFKIVGTTMLANASTHDVVVEFRCHGGDRSYSSAQSVARALFDRLQGAGGRVASGYIHKALLIGQQDLTDPDTGWPFTLSRYTISIED